jgi:hypothetical protein
MMLGFCPLAGGTLGNFDCACAGWDTLDIASRLKPAAVASDLIANLGLLIIPFCKWRRQGSCQSLPRNEFEPGSQRSPRV